MENINYSALNGSNFNLKELDYNETLQISGGGTAAEDASWSLGYMVGYFVGGVMAISTNIMKATLNS